MICKKIRIDNSGGGGTSSSSNGATGQLFNAGLDSAAVSADWTKVGSTATFTGGATYLTVSNSTGTAAFADRLRYKFKTGVNEKTLKCIFQVPTVDANSLGIDIGLETLPETVTAGTSQKALFARLICTTGVDNGKLEILRTTGTVITTVTAAYAVTAGDFIQAEIYLDREIVHFIFRNLSITNGQNVVKYLLKLNMEASGVPFMPNTAQAFIGARKGDFYVYELSATTPTIKNPTAIWLVDSISVGYNAGSHMAHFVDRFHQEVGESYAILGGAGDFIHIGEALLPEVKLIAPSRNATIFVALGANDLNQGASTATMRTRIQALIDAYKGAGYRVVLLEISASNAYDPTAVNADWLTNVTGYSKYITGIHRESKVYGSINLETFYGSDGTHKDPMGNNAYFNVIKYGYRGYSGQTEAYLQRLTNTLTNGRKFQIYRMVQNLIDNRIWDDLELLDLFSLDTSGNSLLNIKGTSFTPTNVGSATFTAYRGFTGASGKYINTNFTPKTQATKLSLDDAFYGIWIYNNAQNANVDFGAADAAFANNITCAVRNTSNNGTFAMHNTSSKTVSSITDSSGWWELRRQVSSDFEVWRNNTRLDTPATRTSTDMPSVPIFTHCRNDNGTPTTQKGFEYPCFIAGKYLGTRKHTILYQILDWYMKKTNVI